MSDITESVRRDLQRLTDAGVVKQTTMRDFNARRPHLQTSLEEMSASDIKRLRSRYSVSQPVLAAYLNISTETVKKWEQGNTQPSGSALKLLHLLSQKGLEAIS